MPRGPDDPREAVLLASACVFVIVWAIATMVQVVDPDRTVPAGVNIVTPIVAGALFGSAWIGRRRKGDDD